MARQQCSEVCDIVNSACRLDGIAIMDRWIILMLSGDVHVYVCTCVCRVVSLLQGRESILPSPQVPSIVSQSRVSLDHLRHTLAYTLENLFPRLSNLLRGVQDEVVVEL